MFNGNSAYPDVCYECMRSQILSRDAFDISMSIAALCFWSLHQRSSHPEICVAQGNMSMKRIMF